MEEYKQEELNIEKRYLTEDEVRALISTSMLNQTEPQRVQSGYIESGNYASGTGWKLTSTEAIFPAITVTGGTVKYNKTSFTDTTHAGYYLGSEGIYFGAASDISKLKYTIADGSFDFVGTVSSRSTLTLANSINASGNLITDIINAKLDTAAKKILSDFTFDSTDYSGAFKTGDITWNATTGAITGGSGGLFNKNGLVFANAGVATITLNGTTGSATFSGTLSAASGTIGALTLATPNNTGDTYIAGGNNLDFTNWRGGLTSGAIMLGLDDSDSDKAKFFVGNYSSEQYAQFDGTNLIVNGSHVGSNVFGDGLDGDVTVSTDITPLARDMFYNDLTITSTGRIRANSYRIFVKGTLTIQDGGKIANFGIEGADGTNYGGAGGTGGDGKASGSLPASISGSDGGVGNTGTSNGVNGVAANKSIGVAGVAGGNGGSNSGGGGGTGGTGGSQTGQAFNVPKSLTSFYYLFDTLPSFEVLGASGGAGGGASGRGSLSGNGGAGGGGGGAGGFIFVAAKHMNLTGDGAISAYGGKGGNGGIGGTDAGGGGGGAGGAGGVILVIYEDIITSGNVFNRDGGVGGTGGAGDPGQGSGANGTHGNAGVVYTLIV